MDWRDRFSAILMVIFILVCLAILVWATITGQPFPEIEGAL